MSDIGIGLTGLAVLLGLFVIRVPVGLAMVGVSGIGLWVLMTGQAAWGVLRGVPYDFVSSWTLSAIPMFLLMGYVCYHAGLTKSLFALAKALLARVPGSLAAASIFACSGFAAVCGSSIACAAAMGRIAIPEMVRAGYDRNFACGTIAAGGTIGALIPPSILMILFGIFAQVSIIKLFIGGITIGLLTAVSYVVVILFVSWLRPEIVPRSMTEVKKGDLLGSLIEMGPIILLILGVFGGLFGGIFTTTEAGAVGAALSILIAFAQGHLSLRTLIDSVTETVATCGSLFIVGFGATMFTQFLSLSGTGLFISSMVEGWSLSYWELMLIITAIYLVLGMFMEPIGAMLITLPIFMPILKVAGVDLVFFGLLVAKLIEIGMITPPFGLNVFVIKSVVGDLTTLIGVFRGILYYLAIDIVVIFIIIAFPSLILLLPNAVGP
jgi:tripartite ATP-independent transporter DctM subunit